ncbi:MAG: hypothetical protein IJU74_08665 [Bacteroidales bacterium]|nr:hypothetical protein [Bacteroidales bacterium]
MHQRYLFFGYPANADGPCRRPLQTAAIVAAAGHHGACLDLVQFYALYLVQFYALDLVHHFCP